MTRIGILSPAHPHAGAYVTHLRQRTNAEFIGVSADDTRGLEPFAEEHPELVLPAEEILDQSDGVIICSTNTTHSRWIETAAASGVDILCEKPLAPTVEEAAHCVDVCDDAGVLLGVAMPLRFSPPVLRAKQQLEADAIGTLHSIVGTNRVTFPGRSWATDSDATGGGAVMDHTVHIVNLFRWLAGEEVADVYAELDTRFHDIDLEDTNVQSMRLTDGTICTHDGSWSRPDEWDTWGEASLKLLGSDGTIAVDVFGQTFKETRDSGESPGISAVHWGEDSNGPLVDDFVQAIRDGRHPRTAGTDGVREVAVIEAAYRSAERGERVSVEY